MLNPGLYPSKKVYLTTYVCLAAASVLLFFHTTLLYASFAIGMQGVAVSLIPALVLFALFIYLAHRFKHQKEVLFLLVGTPALLAFSLFILPGHVPDEAPHIWQAAALFSRNPAGFNVPFAYYEPNLPGSYREASAMLSSSPAWEDTFVCSRYIGSNFFYIYLVPYFVLSIFRFFNFNAYAALFAARIANAAIYLLVAYRLIKTVPVGKTLLLVYCLNPMLIQQQASFSADALINIFSLSFFVCTIYISKLNSTSIKEWLVYSFLCVANCLSKSFAYAPMTLLVLFVIKRKYKAWARVWVAVTAFCALAAIGFVSFYQGDFMKDAIVLVRQPLYFIHVLVKSMWELGTFWGESFAGYNLGALSINTWLPCVWAFYVLIALTTACCDDEVSLNFDNWDRVLLIGVACIDAVFILLSMRGWSVTIDGRSDIIMGVQGRYLIPLVIAPLFGYLKYDSRSCAKSLGLVSSICLAGILAISLYCIVLHF